MLKICPELPKEWDSIDDVSPHWGNMTWRQKMDKFRIQNAITGRLQKLCKYTFNIYWIKMKEKERKRRSSSSKFQDEFLFTCSCV